jgi:hypothetical protein
VSEAGSLRGPILKKALAAVFGAFRWHGAWVTDRLRHDGRPVKYGRGK